MLEHNLRLLEAVKRARCSMTILAYLAASDIESNSRRLGRAGIPSTTRWIPTKKLCQSTADSRMGDPDTATAGRIWRLTDDQPQGRVF